MSLFDQLQLVLQKLRVGTFNQVLADTFNISLPTVSRIFISWINFLYFMLGSFCIWPSREKIRQHAPASFKAHYPKCRSIVDATEIKVQAPSSMVLNSEMFSAYKSHTTYKGNVVIAIWRNYSCKCSIWRVNFWQRTCKKVSWSSSFLGTRWPADGR